MKQTVMIKENYKFKHVLTKGICCRGKIIDVFVKKNHKNINELGIAVGKKSGNSVKRNKIKRLIRENYKNIEDNLIKGYSIVILWKKNAEFRDFNFYSIKEELENLFIKLKIL